MSIEGTPLKILSKAKCNFWLGVELHSFAYFHEVKINSRNDQSAGPHETTMLNYAIAAKVRFPPSSPIKEPKVLLLFTILDDGLSIPQINVVDGGRQRFAFAVLPRCQRQEKFAVALAKQH